MTSEKDITQELGSIDVVMCSDNSNKPWFKQCLNSIKREIPLHCFILIDCLSTDGTERVVRDQFTNVKLISSKAKLGAARRMGIQLVDTPWFVFLDDDIELPLGWYSRMTQHVAKNVGGVAGFAIESSPIWERFSYLTINKKNATRFVTVDSSNQDIIRGLTCNTLCRTATVKDWNPSPNLAAYEDHHLLRHIVRNGFKWIAASDPVCRHHGTFSLKSEFKKAKWNGAGARIANATTLRRLIRKTAYVVQTSLYGSLRIRNPLLMLHIFAEHFGMIIGYLRWSRYTSSYTYARR